MSVRKSFLYTFAIALGLLCATGVLAWTGPSLGFPGGNASAPLNVSSAGQIKSGILTAGGLSAPTICIGVDCRSAWPSGGTSQWTTSGSSIYYNGGNVGIGTVSPASTLEVSGTVRADTYFIGPALYLGGASVVSNQAGGSPGLVFGTNGITTQGTGNISITSGTLNVSVGSGLYGINAYSPNELALYGHSDSGYGVYGTSGSAWGGVFVAPMGLVAENAAGNLYSELETAGGYGLLTNEPVLASDVCTTAGKCLNTVPTGGITWGGMFAQYPSGGCFGPNGPYGCGCPSGTSVYGFGTYSWSTGGGGVNFYECR